MVVAVAVLAATGTFAAVGKPNSAATDNNSPSSLTTLHRQDLSAQTDVSATLSYAGNTSIVNQAQGTITALPSIGQVIGQDQVLYEVNGEPVVLIYGSTPAYRTLSEGAYASDVTGPDVAELNADLVTLGYATTAEIPAGSDEFTWETKEALEKLQAHLGVAQTGTLTLGQAVFLPAAVRVAAVSATLGAAARPGQAVLTATSDSRQVTIALDASQQSEVAVGDKVTITLPNNESDARGGHLRRHRGQHPVRGRQPHHHRRSHAKRPGSHRRPSIRLPSRSPSPPAASRTPSSCQSTPCWRCRAAGTPSKWSSGRRPSPRSGVVRALRRRRRPGPGHRIRALGRPARRGPGAMTPLEPVLDQAVGHARATAPVLEVDAVTKTYPSHPPVEALRGVSFTVGQGELVAIVGPSGSGKTTLLHLIGTLDLPTTGTVRLTGLDVADLSDRDLAALRATRIGFVFQQFFLSEHQSVLDNVADGLLYAGVRQVERRERALEALSLVGLDQRPTARPTQLSGGQRQRVAIARALVGQPTVVLADEPTGNLDSATGQSILALFQQLHDHGVTIVVITHDQSVAERMPRRIEMLDGIIVADTSREPSGGDLLTGAAEVHAEARP